LIGSHPGRYILGMTDASTLRPADSAEVADALAYALRYDGNRRVFHADDAMARITAEHLIRHLAQAGFVLMRQDPAASPTTSNMPSSID
jgi:hypothetical protein